LCSLLAVCTLGAATPLVWEWDTPSPSATVPVLLWTDSSIFTSPSSQVLDTITNKDVDFVLASLLKTQSGESKLATYFDDNRKTPEVVVLFIEPELTTDQIAHIASSGSFSHLKSAFEAAGSSLAIPYATVGSFSLFDEALSHAFEPSTQGSIFISRMPESDLFVRLGGQSGVTTVEIDSLMTELKSSNVFANGVTDLVLICFDKSDRHNEATFSSHDALIGTLHEGIRTATNGNYVAMYSASRPSPSLVLWTFEQPSDAEYIQYVLDSNNCTSNCTNSTVSINYFPGPLIEVYMISAFLIAMLFTGGCAIFSLQTPDRWEAPRMKHEQY